MANVTETRWSWEKEELLDGSKVARVFSPSNIALAKYWGKRDGELSLPANGSISVSLKDYGSFTTVEFNRRFETDELVVNGKAERTEKAIRVLDEIRARAGVRVSARVQSFNNFPTGAGLASSASGLSALTLAAARALGLSLELRELSAIARRGSGSACRSLFGGFVEWARGERADGTDSVAGQVAPVSHWPLKIVLAVVSGEKKATASTGGMEATRKTSPYFSAWVEDAQAQLPSFRAAILARDFDALAEAAETNCLRMHASAMAASPPVLYWRGATLEVIHRVWALRAGGLPTFFTIDAGPNVVVFCEPKAARTVQDALTSVGGVKCLVTEPGEGARDFTASEWWEEA